MKNNVLLIPEIRTEFIVNEESVKNFFKPVLDREKEMKNENLYISDSLYNEYKVGTKISTIKEFTVTIQTYNGFARKMTHRQILESTTRKVFNYLEALSLMKASILSGNFDDECCHALWCYYKVPEVMGASGLYTLIVNRMKTKDSTQLGIVDYPVFLDHIAMDFSGI